MKTQAAVFRRPHEPLAIEDVDLGPLKAQDVLVEIAASGVCHSDVHVYEGLRDWPTPMVMGHEGAGVVQEVGEGVSNVKPGDRVVMAMQSACGHCRQCAAGRSCVTFAHPFGTLYDGGTRLSRDGESYYHFAAAATFARHAITHYSNAIPVPDDVSFETACLVGCGVPTGLGAAVNTAKVERGSVAVVIGCGGVGLNVIQGCRLMGAGKIIAADTRPEKLALAEAFGATDTIDASKNDVPKTVMEITGGRGADFGFEVIGKVETYLQMFQCLGRRGQGVFVGGAGPGAEITLPASEIYMGKGIRGSLGGEAIPARDFPWIFDLYKTGQIKLDELVTRRAKLEDVTDAMINLAKGEGVRTVLRM